ncbi:Dexamethasone-induced Ras-related protein 1 [Eumeta japonica]|uniref:Dexamethasone-induced Ras-related protein 1 n=1 Tax=Eumeta variegata TaxID=151549 RepID=A0A4C1TP56_EUMVA|nr:Dexamethasone-induced Ras-related protein 1 [Eumeta japonica]
MPSTVSSREGPLRLHRSFESETGLKSSRVGKTSLVARFLGTKFEESYTPTIEDFHRKLYRIRGEVHQLDLLDTSGNHPFPAMRSQPLALCFGGHAKPSLTDVVTVLVTPAVITSVRVPGIVKTNKQASHQRELSVDTSNPKRVINALSIELWAD